MKTKPVRLKKIDWHRSAWLYGGRDKEPGVADYNHVRYGAGTKKPKDIR